MKLVVAEKPSVAQSLAAGAGGKRKKGWVSGRRRLAGVLGAWAIWWSWAPAGSLGGAVRQMAVCGSAYSSRPLEV